METKNIFAENSVTNEPGKYHLSIQWSQENMEYVILNILDKKYYGLKQITLGEKENKRESLEKILSEDSLITVPFTSSSFLIQSYKAMLVPESLFDAGNLKAFLKFHHEIDEKDHLHFVPIKLAEAFLVFSVPSEIEDIVKKHFPDVKFAHHALPFIDNALRSSNPNDNSTYLNINFGVDFFDILIVRNQKILLYNSFFYKKYADVLYFLVNILNLFSLQPDNTKIVFSGVIDQNSEIEIELRKIFKSIQYAQYNLDYKYTEAFFSLPRHRFINLLNLYNCV